MKFDDKGKNGKRGQVQVVVELVGQAHQHDLAVGGGQYAEPLAQRGEGPRAPLERVVADDQLLDLVAEGAPNPRPHEPGALRRGRRELAAKTGIDEKRLLGLANSADRMRIKGMGKEYAAILPAVGVDTVRELKYRNLLLDQTAVVTLKGAGRVSVDLRKK